MGPPPGLWILIASGVKCALRVCAVRMYIAVVGPPGQCLLSRYLFPPFWLRTFVCCRILPRLFASPSRLIRFCRSNWFVSVRWTADNRPFQHIRACGWAVEYTSVVMLRDASNGLLITTTNIGVPLMYLLRDVCCIRPAFRGTLW